MDDTIYRQAAIDAILAVTGNSSVRELYEHVQEHGLSDMWSGGVNAAIDIIIALPSVQPDMSEYSDKLWKAAYERGKEEAQQRWIPCSERLPENGHYYLWCSDMGNVQSDYYWDGFENGMKYGYNIVAWMPLPEPYAERRTNEGD